jgi:hypothetical protein
MASLLEEVAVPHPNRADPPREPRYAQLRMVGVTTTAALAFAAYGAICSFAVRSLLKFMWWKLRDRC